jgi:hypothetical protein
MSWTIILQVQTELQNCKYGLSYGNADTDWTTQLQLQNYVYEVTKRLYSLTDVNKCRYKLTYMTRSAEWIMTPGTVWITQLTLWYCSLRLTGWLLKKFPCFYGTRNFNIVPTKDYCFTLSWSNLKQLRSSEHISLKSTSILLYHQLLYPPCCFVL